MGYKWTEALGFWITGFILLPKGSDDMLPTPAVIKSQTPQLIREWFIWKLWWVLFSRLPLWWLDSSEKKTYQEVACLDLDGVYILFIYIYIHKCIYFSIYHPDSCFVCISHSKMRMSIAIFDQRVITIACVSNVSQSFWGCAPFFHGSQQQIYVFSRNLLFHWSIFRRHVSFRGCSCFEIFVLLRIF